jgi:metal-responsive CopG/Arc/MetJ family transcriptional regulator
MRTSKTISVSLPPAQLKQAEKLARKENRTMSELFREALRQYQQRQEAPVNTDLIAALRAVQEDARRTGLDKLTQREINAEITANRKERQKTVNQPGR